MIYVKDLPKNVSNNLVTLYIKAKPHQLTDHEISGITERIAMELGTQLSFIFIFLYV